MSLDQVIDFVSGLTTFQWVVGFCGIFALGIVATMLNLRRFRPNKRIMENGLDGQATILSAEWTKVRHSGLPEIRFVLAVTMPGWEPYQVTLKKVMDERVYRRMHANMILPVKVDPANREKLEFNYSEKEMLAKPIQRQSLPDDFDI